MNHTTRDVQQLEKSLADQTKEKKSNIIVLFDL